MRQHKNPVLYFWNPLESSQYTRIGVDACSIEAIREQSNEAGALVQPNAVQQKRDALKRSESAQQAVHGNARVVLGQQAPKVPSGKKR